MDFAQVRWTDRRQFVAWDEDGHNLVMDAPAIFGGEGAGMRPLQVFLAALAGCSGMDVISILEKKRQKICALEVRVGGQQRENEFPKIYERIVLEYTVTGYGVSEEAVRRSIELSKDKYCSVAGMIGPHVSIETSYVIVEPSPPGATNSD